MEKENRRRRNDVAEDSNAAPFCMHLIMRRHAENADGLDAGSARKSRETSVSYLFLGDLGDDSNPSTKAPAHRRFTTTPTRALNPPH